MRRRQNVASDVGLLVLRAVSGGLLAGHGAQKLFGWFGGPGPRGTAGLMEAIDMRPGDAWALAAGGSEFAAGVLTALGLCWPVGPIATIGPMGMAIGTVHRGKPIWVTEGGAELPVRYMAVAVALTLTGPGRLSLDRVLRVRVPGPLVALTAAGVAGGLAVGLSMARRAASAPAPAPAPEEPPADGVQPEPSPRSAARSR